MSAHPGPRGSSAVPKYLAVLAIALFASAALAGIYSFGLLGGPSKTGSSTTSSTSSTSCASSPPYVHQKVPSRTFGAITEYTVAADRSPGGIAVAPDGSLWFGEWGLPGVAHLFPNGTLTEYPWPYPDSSGSSLCGQATNIWGVALWNGSTWGSDFFYSRLVGINPSTGTSQLIDLPNGTLPYTLAVGPDNNLWFTALGSPQIGKVSALTHVVTYYSLPVSKAWESVFMLFKNGSLGYVLALDGYDPQLAQVYSFDPGLSTPSFSPVGQNQTLYAPTGIALGEGGLWASEHSASAMAFLNFTTGRWTLYPTSTVPYTPWVLTYFVASNGTAVWFNEHYGNRMGVIYDGATRLTEYQVSDPPIYNITKITDPVSGVNMVTMGVAPDGAWFAAAGGFVGYVNGSYVPPFSISATAPSVNLAPGGSARMSLEVGGGMQQNNLSLQFSDNEFNNGTAKLLTFTAGPPVTYSGYSSVDLNISASSSLKPGTYIAAATVTNGSIYRSVYFTVTVT
jgi:streptogramin lyase